MQIRSIATLALLFGTVAVTGVSLLPVQAQDKAAPPTVMAKIVVTAEGEKDQKPPEVKREDVVVKVGKERMQVKHWEAAKGQYADLALFILIDDVLDPSTGGLWGDVKEFIQAQPATTFIGVGYMRNGAVSIAQDLTSDHDKAVKALRLPAGNPGTYGNPYLCLMDLIKRWPKHGGRREVLMITDGIDRMRQRSSAMDVMTPSVDVRSASNAAQREGILVYSFYARGVGHLYRGNSWAASGGQNGLAQLADETGAESYFLGYNDPVSFKPYFTDLQNLLDNQYWLALDMKPGTKVALKSINISTEVSGVELVSADSISVPAAK
jgi:hypothetical protein